MKTIEEKIEDIANKILPCNTLCRDDYCNIDFRECKLYKDIYNALTEIAEYQKEIDKNDKQEGEALLYAVNKTAERARKEMIDRACEWICECCSAQLGNDNGWVGCEGKRDIDCPTIKSLIKAMEKEND